MFFKMNKSENFTPGFICVLHTFGRSLQWNPHIHVLLSEGGSGNNSIWRNVKHFNYAFLRNSFRMTLLNLLEKHIGSSFKRVKSYIYKHCPNSFYVYAKPTLGYAPYFYKFYLLIHFHKPMQYCSNFTSCCVILWCKCAFGLTVYKSCTNCPIH